MTESLKHVSTKDRALPYLGIGSPGNSWRLSASACVRNTGMMWTLAGRSTPRVAKHHSRALPGPGKWVFVGEASTLGKVPTQRAALRLTQNPALAVPGMRKIQVPRKMAFGGRERWGTYKRPKAGEREVPEGTSRGPRRVPNLLHWAPPIFFFLPAPDPAQAE